MFRVILIVYLLATINFTYVRPRNEVNNRPIIAVLSQLLEYDDHYTYIAASYVKYLESAGARVVPVLHSMKSEDVINLFSSVNGILFPGGSTAWFKSAYYKHGKLLHDLAIKANNNGDYFPMWGTCLGFQTLLVFTAGTSDILSGFHAEDIILPLHFTSTARTSRMFSNMSKEMYTNMATKNITYNHHKYGVSPTTFYSTASLSSFFNILSTNLDLDGKEFISTVQGKTYPFYGTQWHPEKNNFEFNGREHISHTKTAVVASQYMANFFVGEARKNLHHFPSAKVEEEFLIYNYNPEYSGDHSNFEQIYKFKV